jgi:putative hydrolase of the HAD superfamily
MSCESEAPVPIRAVIFDYVCALRLHVKTGLLSNAWPNARASIHDHVNESMFDDMIFSAEVGLAKPDRRIYELALARLQVQSAEAIFVDDVRENVETAQAIGMAGILVESTEQTIAEIERHLEASRPARPRFADRA